MSEQQFIVDNPSAGAFPKNGLGAAGLVTFGLGSAVFSIDASQVSEIIHPLPITPLPHCPSSIEGVAVLRGELIALLNIRSIVNLADPPSTQRCKWIVLSPPAGSTRFAFPVDKLIEIAAHGNEDLPESDQTTENRSLLSRKKPDFPMLDISSIISKIESAMH